MTSNFSRLTKSYLSLHRPDVAKFFPKNIFIREPNQLKSGNNEITCKVNHNEVLKSTVHKLTESFEESELYVIGTVNSSNLLANRTKRLIDEIKPDTVFVQTNCLWWDSTKRLKFVKSQEEMNLANKYLKKTMPISKKLMYKSLSGLKFQLFNLIYKYMFGLKYDYNPLLPGLEVKYALEQAQKLNSKIVFLGEELDELTQEMLLHEKRFSLLRGLFNYIFMNRNYKLECFEISCMITVNGLSKFIESCLDSKNTAFFIAVMEKLSPEYKKILIDRKDHNIYEKIIANKGKKMVAVVNQQHMEGIIHHWCSSFGQEPSFNKNCFNPINPIGDMNLRKSYIDRMYHVIMREIKSNRLRSPPASFTNDINIYHREFNHQYEHRNM